MRTAFVLQFELRHAASSGREGGGDGEYAILPTTINCSIQYAHHVVIDTFLNASDFSRKHLREWNPIPEVITTSCSSFLLGFHCLKSVFRVFICI